MKKLYALLLSAALCLGLAACANTAPESAQSVPTDAESASAADTENAAADTESAEGVSTAAAKVYQETIAALEAELPEGDSLAWAEIACGTGEKVLVVAKASETYADGQAIAADVYQYADGEAKYIDSVKSGGTAYPISYTKDAILFGGNHYSGKLEVHDGAGDLSVISGTYMETDASPLLEVYAVENGERTLKSSEEIPAAEADAYDYYINAYADELAEILIFQ